MKILITGGAGFIGSHLVRYLVEHYPAYQIINLDGLTYAGNLKNLSDLEGKANYRFIKADIRNFASLLEIFEELKPDRVIHLAAESHVDRSIREPFAFAETNVMGTLSLLEACRKLWQGSYKGKLFYHVSTDEVYGSLPLEGGALFTEETPYDPRSPYSASKASSDHFVRAYYHTYGLPIVLSNCSNNFGPYQFPEKLIPLMVRNIQRRERLPIYGKGENIRDWLYVGDHIRAIDLILHQGRLGESYNIGGGNEWSNIDLVRKLIEITDRLLERPAGSSEQLIQFVADRKGHDLRYAIDSTKLKEQLGWQPELDFELCLEETVAWYLEHSCWLEEVTSGAYQDYYKEYYSGNL